MTTQAAPATAAPAATTEATSTTTPATTTPQATTTPSAQSSDSTQQAQTTTQADGQQQADAGDLLFDQKPDDNQAQKLTVDDHKKFLEGKIDPKELEGKTDEEIAKLYDEQKAKEGEAASTVDFEKITLPEGIKMSEANQKALQEFVTKNNLTGEQAQAAAQEMATMGAKLQQENLAQWQNMKKGWREKVESDPVLGGNNLKQTISDCNDIVRKFAGSDAELKEFQADLIFLGLGNKPSFVRFLKNVHAATKEDGLDGKSTATAQPQVSPAKRMYPNMRSENDPA